MNVSLRFRRPGSFRLGFGSATGNLIPVKKHGKPSHLQQSSMRSILEHDTLVVGRQLEVANVLLGFEQYNRYVIQSQSGSLVGYLLEADSLGKSIARQVLRTHRAFHVDCVDTDFNSILQIHRPLTFINSKITVGNSYGLIGEVHQRWHPLRRRYDLFVHSKAEFLQFGEIDEVLLSWTFSVRDEGGRLLATIDRNFTNLAREILTDTGCYVIRFDPSERGLSQRAVVLACAVSIDFDYFSRLSGRPLWTLFPFFRIGEEI